MVEKILIFQAVLLLLIVVLNMFFLITLLLKKDKSIKSNEVGLYENHSTKNDNDKFADIIDAQMTIQEATNLVHIKCDKTNEIAFLKAQDFLDDVISLSETYKNS